VLESVNEQIDRLEEAIDEGLRVFADWLRDDSADRPVLEV
jgi:hypothetical protein